MFFSSLNDNFAAHKNLIMKKTLLLTALCVAFVAGAQEPVTAVKTLHYIRFDDFKGSGFSPSPVAGQLSSGSWSVKGMSDGDLYFGDSASIGDLARGLSNGKVSTGGLYAFNVNDGNTKRILGLQPIGADFTPGSITLRLHNLCGDTIHSLYLMYDIYTYNDQGRSTSLNFSYSTDSSNYIALPSLDYMTKDTAAASPAWAKTMRLALIHSLHIADSAFFYLRWTGDDAGGSGSRDEYGIGNIRFAANPDTVFHDYEFIDSLGYCEGTTFCFDDHSYVLPDDSLTAIIIDHGDGSQSTEQKHCHTYSAAGSYTIKQIIQTKKGISDTTFRQIVVLPNPLAHFTYNYGGNGTSILFSDQSTISSGNIESYRWDFGDGDTSSLPDPTHDYGTTGSFVPCLSLLSDSGCAASACDTIILLTTGPGISRPQPSIKVFATQQQGVYQVLSDAPLNATACLFDLQGRLLLSLPYEGKGLLLSLAGLPAGPYLLRIADPQGLLGTTLVAY